MDTSEYLNMFLAEAREHLQSLNLAVVRVEETPDDRETVDEIFRIAHTLKGMSATMGFDQIAALTHKMEDVFELLRRRTGALDASVVDVLLVCLDALSEAVESIDATGQERLEPSELIERLQALIRSDDAEDDEGAAEVETPEPQPVPAGALHVRAEVAADALMPSVRAFMILAALAEQGAVLRSVPDAEAVDDWSGCLVEAWVDSEHEACALAAAVRAVPDVTAVDVREDGGEAAAPSPAAAPPVAEAAAPAPAQQRKSSSTVRVEAERLDRLMHLMGELVVHRTQVEELSAGSGIPELAEAVAALTRSSQALQALVMQVRMIPVESVFLRFPRLVRDLSSKLGKQVELVLTGRETELDRTVVDAVGDPLVHLVRNALDHALEPAEERVAAGKPPTGRLEMSARHAGGTVLITVTDDGRGIDPARVARKACDRGLLADDAVAAVDMARAIELLFTPGFSTAEVTSDLSGRGVGMDAVRNAIRGLGGNVVMTSEQGVGTSVEIRLPLTLAIMPALLVESSGLAFAIPLERVERTLHLPGHVVRSVAGRPMLVLDGGVLPLLDLAQSLGHDTPADGAYVVIARGGDRRLALRAGRLVGQRELVTRPVPAEIAGGAALSGAAVLSDGGIALIVDCDALRADGGAAAEPFVLPLPNAA